jgi:RNA 3'-terminal phosphate cyclase (ATP)
MSIEIDGSQGEGGGQILRSALALSLITGRAFRIRNIRARREKPGLMRQHLTAVRAAAQLGSAQLHGAEIGSCTLTFEPSTVRAGEYHFAVGTAGSATLVLQTILPPLLKMKAPSRLVLEGGTHNIHAPPYDFLSRAFLPLVERIGHHVTMQLVRPGFYPIGGGEIYVEIAPAESLCRLEVLQRGTLLRRSARAVLARLPRHIGERELRIVEDQLRWRGDELHIEEPEDVRGPGNVLLLELEYEQVTEVFTGFGVRGKPAEQVAESAVTEIQQYLASHAPVGEHLADQLLLPMALGPGGAFRTTSVTPHTRTNMDIIRLFLPVVFDVQHDAGAWRVSVET